MYKTQDTLARHAVLPECGEMDKNISHDLFTALLCRRGLRTLLLYTAVYTAGFKLIQSSNSVICTSSLRIQQ